MAVRPGALHMAGIGTRSPKLVRYSELYRFDTLELAPRADAVDPIVLQLLCEWDERLIHVSKRTHVSALCSFTPIICEFLPTERVCRPEELQAKKWRAACPTISAA
jgi:hypothetical protein